MGLSDVFVSYRPGSAGPIIFIVSYKIKGLFSSFLPLLILTNPSGRSMRIGVSGLASNIVGRSVEVGFGGGD